MSDATDSASPMHSLALVGAVDPALLGLVDLALCGEDVVVIRASLHLDQNGDGFVRLVSHSPVDLLDEEPARLDLPMSSDCPTCSLREVIAAVAQDRAAQDPRGSTVVLLPSSIELVHLLPRLAQELEGGGVRLAGTAHVLDAVTACEELLEHRPLAQAGLEAFPGDMRCTGEIHMVNIGYADVVLALGWDEGAGADLIEHLRPHDALLLPGLESPLLDCLLSVSHDVDASLRRIHPATTRAWGGPDGHGVWTLDLSASLPFHPGRLRELVADLAGGGLCARGCFWLPSRPGRVCAWEVAGGAVSVGDAGTWAEVPVSEDTEPAADRVVTGPRCHLVVTGVGDEVVRERVRRAFGEILLRDDELAEALSWVGGDDGLGDWFGDA